MKIQILKPTVVNGENVKVGEELDVKKSVANLLINSKKAISLEKTEVFLSFEISEEQLEIVKKELETEFEKTINELSSEIELYKKIIKEKDSLIAEQLNEIEKKLDLEKVLTEKNEKLKAREAEYKALYDDIGSMTFKDLKAKYEIN